ncbi:MAG: GxxExxY protein [Spirosomataceae bacterium]|jgi:GxxExxY protein|nr:GxxExxY protein [Bacteroidota bacterium]
MTQKHLNDLTYKIIGAAIEVHKNLGPGLLEKVYEKCLTKELIDLGFKVDFQKSIPLNYKGIDIEAELRFDLMVNEEIIVEIKSVESFHPLFDAQLLTYMKLFEKPKGILLNFNVVNIFKEGQKTFVNEYFKKLPKE